LTWGRQQIRVVQDGGDPLGVCYDPNAALDVPAGNFFRA
jgi:hypothetical protein